MVASNLTILQNFLAFQRWKLALADQNKCKPVPEYVVVDMQFLLTRLLYASGAF